MRSIGSVLLVLLLTVISIAQEKPDEALYFNKHEGFYLRMFLGLGHTALSEDVPDYGELKLSGLGAQFRIQIGAAVTENFILYGDLGGTAVSDPDIQFMGSSGSTEGTSLSVSDYGAGMAYYFMPENLFLSFSLLFPKATIETSMGEGESKTGLGFFVSGGKEWWISERWALGASLFWSYAGVKDQAPLDDQTISVYTIGATFSATFD